MADCTAREIAERLIALIGEPHTNAEIIAFIAAALADAEARVRQETEAIAQREIERVNQMAQRSSAARGALSARLATAEQALKEYGQHKRDCLRSLTNQPMACSCGLSAALGDPQ